MIEKSAKSNNLRTEYSLDIKMNDISRPVRLKASTAPQRPMDILPALQSFQNEIVSLAVDVLHSQEKQVSCRAGCGACCSQLVPISEIEARNLAKVISRMPAKRRKEIKRRFKSVMRSLEENHLTERLQDAWLLEKDIDREELALEYFHLNTPCPFLEKESCSIHPDRPLSCREFLVTSPAENCKAPTEENIAMVDLPARLSYLAYKFSDGQGKEPSHWFPLTLALGWFDDHKDDVQPLKAGDEMLRHFLEQLAL
jgi:Fe-S-cluster containining protein